MYPCVLVSKRWYNVNLGELTKERRSGFPTRYQIALSEL